MLLILRANEFRVCKPSGGNIQALFSERTASQFCSQLWLTVPACRDDEKSRVKNESSFEQGLRIFNWICIQLGSETIISCGVQKGNLLLQPLVQWWRRGDVKIPSPFRFDGTLILEGNVMP